MILEEETFSEFGYLPSELKPKSNKKILAACDDCGKVRLTPKNGYRPLCGSCVQKGEKSGFFGKHHTEEAKEKNREASKKQWRDPDFIKKMMTARNKTPNKDELFVDLTLQKHRPKSWKFNGNFEAGVSIGGLIPDFVNVNGEKVVIEVFGEPFHDPVLARKVLKRNIRWTVTEFGRKAVFAQLGYKCIVLWSRDLRTANAEQFVLKTLEREGI